MTVSHRAPTPSAAAELVVQTRREFDKHVSDLRESLVSLIRYRLAVSARRIHELAGRRGFRRPLDILRQTRQRADDLTARLALGLKARLTTSHRRFNVAHLRVVSFDFRKKMAALRLVLQGCDHHLSVRVERSIRLKRDRWERLALQLEERSPLKVLERGHAIATDAGGNVLRDAGQVAIGDEVGIQLHRGRLTTEVKSNRS